MTFYHHPFQPLKTKPLYCYELDNHCEIFSFSVPETSSSLHFCVLPLNSDQQIIKSHFPQLDYRYLKECPVWSGEMAHWVKVLAAMLSDPATHRVKRKNRFQPSCPDFHRCTVSQVHNKHTQK